MVQDCPEIRSLHLGSRRRRIKRIDLPRAQGRVFSMIIEMLRPLLMWW